MSVANQDKKDTVMNIVLASVMFRLKIFDQQELNSICADFLTMKPNNQGEYDQWFKAFLGK